METFKFKLQEKVELIVSERGLKNGRVVALTVTHRGKFVSVLWPEGRRTLEAEGNLRRQ